MDSLLIIPTLLLPFILFRWFRRLRNPMLNLPLPPGPKGYPIVGNLFSMPKKMPWKTFHEWSKTYGDVLYLDIPKQPTIVLDSAEAVIELLEKRSDIYSDRTQYVMDELMFHRWNFVIMRYGPEWRAHRRLFHQHFNQRESMQYRPAQLRGTRDFLRRALDGSVSLGENLRLLYSAVVLKVVYDMDVDTMDNEYIHLSHDAFETASTIRVPGAFWIEFFPLLKYLPDWVPGTGHFKKHAKRGTELWTRMHHEPFDSIKQSIRDGKSGDSVIARMLETVRDSSDEQQEMIVRNVIGITYGGAADTTTTAAQSFVIAMSLHPEVQRKAQEELDRVIGPNRLPEFSDFEELIYIQAIVLESLRWNVVLPVGVPHRAIREDEFRGFRIPKGATIIPNLWAMLRNPDEFPEPHLFKPERFLTEDGHLNPNVRNPSTISFGFGRRVCPGRWFASAALFISISTILHTMDIHPIIGEDGVPYNPFDVEIDGILMNSENVPCTMTPRSKNVERLIHDWEASSA